MHFLAFLFKHCLKIFWKKRRKTDLSVFFRVSPPPPRCFPGVRCRCIWAASKLLEALLVASIQAYFSKLPSPECEIRSIRTQVPYQYLRGKWQNTCRVRKRFAHQTLVSNFPRKKPVFFVWKIMMQWCFSTIDFSSCVICFCLYIPITRASLIFTLLDLDVLVILGNSSFCRTKINRFFKSRLKRNCPLRLVIL